MIKKLIAVSMMALMAFSSIAEARGGFGMGRSSFSSSRSFSRPSYSYSRPSYVAPRPIVRNTTVVHQTNVTQHSGGGLGFLGTMFGSGLGSYFGTRLAQPSQQPAPICPVPLPAGWNTPCVPQGN